MKKRNSSIELLKLIAIIMIVMSHAMPDSVNLNGDSMIHLNNATTNWQVVVALLIHNLGQIGNAIFIICSSWFLLDSKKINIRKIIYMVGDCFFISVGIFCVFIFKGYAFAKPVILKQFAPVTLGNCWFITCYILIYMIHPLLNIIVDNINQKQLLKLNLITITIYCVIDIVVSRSLFFYNRLIGFIVVYFIIAYIKKYPIKKREIPMLNILLLGIGIWIIGTISMNILGLKISILYDKMLHWNEFTNPIFLIISLVLFYIFKKYHFYKNIINYLSSITLLIYVIHCNNLVRFYLRFDIFDYIYRKYTYQFIDLWILLYSAVSLILSVIIATIYDKSLRKIVRHICDKLFMFCEKFFNKVINYIVTYTND